MTLYKYEELLNVTTELSASKDKQTRLPLIQVFRLCFQNLCFDPQFLSTKYQSVLQLATEAKIASDV